MALAAIKAKSGLNGVFKILITCLLLSACSSNSSLAPISDRQQPPSIKMQTHRVSTGETLYSIAWRYGLDYKRLARRNGIASSYTIYPGQLLQLDVNAIKPVVSVASETRKTMRKSSSRSIKKTSKTSNTIPSQLNAGRIHWRWPAGGRLLSTFSAKNGLNKGIDIAGKLGEPVLSAGSGNVVYAGNGLRGYGKLLIIKHNQKYLSAYAHNRRLLVSEGDAVRAGQKIAEMGSSGTDRNKLHFEIRRDGKPIDPLHYLPKR